MTDRFKTTLLVFLFAASSLGGGAVSFAKLTPIKKGPKLTKRETNVCQRRDLQLKNCYLYLDYYTVRLWNQKMSVSNNVSRSLVDLPLTGEKVEWVSGEIEKLAGQHFVQWVAWEAPSQTNEIQTKHWYVYRLQGEKAELVHTFPLEKRIRTIGKPKSDAQISFGLRLENKQPTWFAGDQKGLLK